MRRLTFQSGFFACALLFTTMASVAHAQNSQGQSQNQQGQNQKGPNPAATPEVDALLLYGVGISGIAGAVAFIRRRSRR